MDKMCVSFLGVLLLALLLSSQVIEAANDTTTNAPTSGTNGTTTPVPSVNVTSKGKNGAERTGGITWILLPVALGASLLHSVS